ncbi:MAG: fibronectin type III domain-containing protein, partial [Candidatus Thiodiazotropha taylori]|nr:fibronectin type III domain-containing protein [Candidatus Thiodiazotropha taylori]MCW4310482.1 fibronectin type III domain-containing protein [Candidatus Thiodiazotropha endolucinida]
MGKNKSFRLITGLILLFVSIGIILSCGGTGTTADTPPGAPTNVQAAAGDTEVTITWTAPTDTGTVSGAAGTITGYKIYYSTTGTVTTSDSSVEVTDPTTLSHTFDNLTNGTVYYFAVTASNGSGESDLSNEVVATPVAGKQDLANIQLSYPAITMDFGAITGNTASPSWAVSDADVDYNITSRPQGATPDNVTIDTDTGVVTATANAASADSGDYTVKATAKSVSTNYEGTQTATLSLTVNKLAGKPTVSVTPADGKVTLGWNAPDAGYQGAVAATIAGYKIYHSE